MTPQEKAKDKRLQDTFNSSLDKFNAKMAEQNNCCAICGRPFVLGASTEKFKKEIDTAFMDHVHGCCPRRLKKFCGACNRGLLCYICNRFVVGVIEMKEIPAGKLAAYMEKWKHIPAREHEQAKKLRAKRKKK